MDKPKREFEKREGGLSETVHAQVQRKLKARREPNSSVWVGLGMTGIVGWSVAVPTLIGTGLGMWLDKNHPIGHSWTLALLVAGLTVGCFNAWHWVAREERSMREDEEPNDA